MRRFAILLLSTLLLTALTACEKDAASGDSDTSKAAQTDEAAEAESNEASAEAGFSVGKIRIIPASNVYSNPDAIKPEELQEMLEEALESTASYDSGAPALGGTLTYDARTSKNIDGVESRDVVLFGDMRREGDDPTTKYTAEILLRSDTSEDGGDSYTELTEDAVEQFAQRIDGQLRIKGANVETLVAVLKSTDESDKAKVAAIHEIREREVTGTEPELRTILSGDDDSLKVAAAAALVKLGDTESHADILELAQTYSRDKNPNFLSMLYILGDMGGDEVITYLDTVAEAHPSAAVRQIARESVEKAIKKKAKMRGQGADTRPKEPTGEKPSGKTGADNEGN